MNNINRTAIRDLIAIILEDFKNEEVRNDFKEWYLERYGEEYEF